MPKLEDIDIDDLWLQQGGAICNKVGNTVKLLQDTLGERIISPENEKEYTIQELRRSFARSLKI